MTSSPSSIFVRTRHPTAAALALAITAVMILVSAPVAAASGDRGALAVCTYRDLSEDSIPRYWGGILTHIDVNPPTMYRLNSSTATAGWRFIVERQRFEKSYTEWKETYRSPIQSAVASSNTPAAFTTMSVGVKLPKILDPENYSWNEVYYRISLKLYWYRADGTLQRVVSHQMKHYDNWVHGEYGWSDKGDYSCPGGHANFVDGPG